jgi:hypothetical protein
MAIGEPVRGERKFAEFRGLIPRAGIALQVRKCCSIRPSRAFFCLSPATPAA